jgi:hypothetical protein
MVQWLIVGVVAACLTAALTAKLSGSKKRDFYTAFMAATATVYIGSALAGGDLKTLVLETSIAAVLFSATLAGQWRSVKFTAIAFFLHGVWDILHSAKDLGANAGASFPILCVAYDWVIASVIWYLAPALDARKPAPPVQTA